MSDPRVTLTAEEAAAAGCSEVDVRDVDGLVYLYDGAREVRCFSPDEEARIVSRVRRIADDKRTMEDVHERNRRAARPVQHWRPRSVHYRPGKHA